MESAGTFSSFQTLALSFGVLLQLANESWWRWAGRHGPVASLHKVDLAVGLFISQMASQR